MDRSWICQKVVGVAQGIDPEVAKVAVVRNPANRTHDVLWKEAQRTAKGLGLKVLSLEVRSPAESPVRGGSRRRKQTRTLYESPG